MTHRIVVLGAGYAGLAAAKRLARLLRRTDVKITLVNTADRFVERVRLHQLAAGQQLRDLPLRDLLTGTGVELRIAHVTAIDAAHRTVQVGAAPHSIGYDTLVYALGSRADVDATPGAAEHAYTVAGAPQALRLQRRVAQIASGGALAVVGGGLTGIEVATEMAESYPDLRVELHTAADAGRWLPRRAQHHVQQALDRWEITLRSRTSVAEVRQNAVVCASGKTFTADAVVWAAGFRAPATAAEAGFAVDERGRMIVDETLCSVSHPEVFAAGDAAAGHAADGAETRMSCQTAMPMGQQAADAIAARLTGRKPEPARIRYAFTNISLGRRDGITQFTHADDTPRGAMLTGRAAAVFKEAIVRSTVLTMRHPGPMRLGLRP
ncbi:NAD(P)/FAD-dependent oxidoreductase [Streptomyces sp. G5(2025)]|uniref:NAD(P)/FAD-dependent oxidoreductase n=1 Tax=Streptomyces sp. G5(2025) TaxID=3406628 RepID=UPI003C2A4D0B